MDISNRIQELIRKNQLNAAKFADRIGVQRSNLSHVLTGRNKPGIDFIEKVLIAFPNIDANWLISGNKQRRAEDSNVNRPEESNVKSEDSIDQNRGLDNQSQQKSINLNKQQGKVDKIIVFYSDNSFEEFKK